MIVDHRVAGLELDRALELLDRGVVLAEPEIDPAQAVDDEAVVRPQLDRPVQHALGAVEVHAHVDPAVAEIVEHERLLGLELQGVQEVGFSACGQRLVRS